MNEPNMREYFQQQVDAFKRDLVPQLDSDQIDALIAVLESELRERAEPFDHDHEPF